MKTATLCILLMFGAIAAPTVHTTPAATAFTLDQVTSYPFPADLVASPTGDRIAWTFFKQGIRSLWVAEAPAYEPRQLVTTAAEDGQELSNPKFSGDGKYIVYVRGGDHGANWDADKHLMPNPTSSPVEPRQQVWSVPVAGGAPVMLGEGDLPEPSPAGAAGGAAGRDLVAFENDGQIMVAPIDGSKPAARMFFARGRNESPAWSPDGRTLAFVTNRGSLGYIGLFTTSDQPIRYLAPSTSLDDLPRWSPDGTRVAFVRRPGRGGPMAPPLAPRPQPWALWVADVKSGEGREVWHSTDTATGSYPRTQGDANLAWGAGDRLVFLSYQDGWPHLYSVATGSTTAGSSSMRDTAAPGATTRADAAAGASASAALLLTPGDFMVEFVSLTPDRRFVIYNANAGDDRDDIERRHLFKVPVDAATPVALTRGTGLEWQPVVTASGNTVAYFGSTAQKSPLPFIRPLTAVAAPPTAGAPGANNGTAGVNTRSATPAGAPADAGRALAANQVPADFPAAQLVTPEHVTFKAADGTTVHGQLFKPAGDAAGAGRKPAVIFVHGGPPRQMLLGWHYRFYYANSYALNQYLASRGFLVLSVNYRLGIGYGYAFHNPRDGGARGAGEYQDVLAGGRYLQGRADVDPARIGLWGGSYGGYLTALGLARNSDVFATGVDIHGVHNWAGQGERSEAPEVTAAARVEDGVTRAQLDEAARVSWMSSPVSAVSTWKSPVLLIHGDDDRNVRVEQTVDLARRLKAVGVKFEEIIIPDDIHDFLSYRSWQRVNSATAAYLERQLKPTAAGTGSRQ